mgnify:CR=1 FL=1
MNQKSSNDRNRTKKVLIVGNGTSRQDPIVSQFVKNWTEHELWACNWAFREYESGELPRLDVLVGDYTALVEAAPFIQERHWKIKIYGKNARSYSIPGVSQIPMDQQFVRDSGTTAVAFALSSKFEEVYIAGFDMGGPDIYQQKHERRNKSIWVDNWRRLNRVFGLDNVSFVGYDHKPFILSDKPADTYAKVYMKGKNHLDSLTV